MDWDDFKALLGTTILVVGLVGGFAYINVYINEKMTGKI